MEDYYYQQMAKIQQKHWWYDGRRKILSSTIATLPLNAPANTRILEIGCGTGANLNMLKKFGSVHGAEPHGFAREYAKKVSECPIEGAFLPHNIPFKENFDLIGVFDVIEHVDEDLKSLKAINTRLNDNGYAIFTVPAFQFLWSKHDEVNHHKRRYTKKQFLALLKEAGYNVKLISYYNFWLFPPVALIRTIKNITKSKAETGDLKLPKSSFINTLLYKMFSSERFLIKAKMPLPFGVSIIAVCQKKNQKA